MRDRVKDNKEGGKQERKNKERYKGKNIKSKGYERKEECKQNIKIVLPLSWFVI